MSAPIPLFDSASPSTGSYSKPRRTSVSSRTSRRRSFNTVKESPQTWSSSPNPRSLKLSSVDDESDEDLDASEDKAGKAKGKRGKKAEVYACEKCHKLYNHHRSLVKHRWQHTDYWQTASSLMMSKHQSVMMLEAAAILTNAGSLPEERSFWPAAVSPPQSGLLGSDVLNAEVIKTQRLASSSPYTSFSSLPPDSHMQHSSDETEDTSPESAFGDFDDQQHGTTRDTSPADKDLDEEEMFALDLGDLKVVEEEPMETVGDEPQLQLQQHQQPRGLPSFRVPQSAHVQQQQAQLPAPRQWSRDWPRPDMRNPFAEPGYGISAPTMGFFQPRNMSISPDQRFSSTRWTSDA